MAHVGVVKRKSVNNAPRFFDQFPVSSFLCFFSSLFLAHSVEEAQPNPLIQRGPGPVWHDRLGGLADPGAEVRALPRLDAPPGEVGRRQRRSRSGCCCCCGCTSCCRGCCLQLLPGILYWYQVGVAVLGRLYAPMDLGQDGLVNCLGVSSRVAVGFRDGGCGDCGCAGGGGRLPQGGLDSGGGVELLDLAHVADPVQKAEADLVKEIFFTLSNFAEY